jgi:hypothetical protein
MSESSFETDGHRDYEQGLAYSPPDFPVHGMEYTRGWLAASINQRTLQRALADTVTVLDARGKSDLFAMSQRELLDSAPFSFEAGRNEAENLYRFVRDMIGYSSRCRRWEEHHNGSCCVVERVRDTYLRPRMIRFLEDMQRHRTQAWREAMAREGRPYTVGPYSVISGELPMKLPKHRVVLACGRYETVALCDSEKNARLIADALNLLPARCEMATLDPGGIYAYHEELAELRDDDLTARYAENEKTGAHLLAVMCLIEADKRGLYIAEAPLPNETHAPKGDGLDIDNPGDKQ